MTALETESLDMQAIRALGALLASRNDEAVRTIDSVGVSAEDFVAPGLRSFWAVLEEHARTRRPVDPFLVAETLKSKIDPVSVVVALQDGVSPGTERHWLERLRETSARRRLVESMRDIARASNAGVPLSELETAVRALPQLVAAKGRVRSAVGDTARIVSEADVAWAAKQSPLVRTGWEELDAEWRITPNLHAVGAGPGVGKSSFVAGLVRNWTERRVTCGVLAYEDDGLDLQRRVLAATAGLDVAGVAGHRLLDEEEHERLGKAYPVRGELERFLLLDDAHPRGKVSDVCASLRQMRAQGAQVGVLDNLSCVRFDGTERHLAIEDALLQLREVALELRMGLLVIGHLKRRDTGEPEETVEPRMSDFAGAASWERFARSMLGLWRTESGVKLKVLKQTLGRWGARFDVHVAEGAATVASVTRETEATQPPRRKPRGWSGGPSEAE